MNVLSFLLIYVNYMVVYISCMVYIVYVAEINILFYNPKIWEYIYCMEVVTIKLMMRFSWIYT